MADTGSAPEIHYAEIYRFVRRRSASAEEAEDVTQAVFVDAAERLERWETDDRPVLAWLYVVARRRMIDQARRRARRVREVPLSEHEAPSADYGPDVRRALAIALRRLPQAQRTVVVARLVEGASFAEIADRLDTTVAAAQMRFSRGLGALRAILEEEGHTP